MEVEKAAWLRIVVLMLMPSRRWCEGRSEADGKREKPQEAVVGGTAHASGWDVLAHVSTVFLFVNPHFPEDRDLP